MRGKWSGPGRRRLDAFRQALELDPIAPEYNNWFALALYRARRYDESIAHCRKVLEIDPYHITVLWFLALSLEQKGKLAEATATMKERWLLQAPRTTGLYWLASMQ